MTKRRLALGALALATSWAAGGSPWQQAPPRAARNRNPLVSDETAYYAGAKLYARECAACHGADRQGNSPAPPLDRADIRSAPSGALFWVLRNGSLRKGMPSFAHLPEPQRWQIIVFLQAQEQVPDTTESRRPVRRRRILDKSSH